MGVTAVEMGATVAVRFQVLKGAAAFHQSRRCCRKPSSRADAKAWEQGPPGPRVGDLDDDRSLFVLSADIQARVKNFVPYSYGIKRAILTLRDGSKF